MTVVLLVVSILASLFAGIVFLMGLVSASSAPQQAAAAACALAIAGIPYFVARAAAAIEMHSDMQAIVNFLNKPPPTLDQNVGPHRTMAVIERGSPLQWALGVIWALVVIGAIIFAVRTYLPA